MKYFFNLYISYFNYIKKMEFNNVYIFLKLIMGMGIGDWGLGLPIRQNYCKTCGVIRSPLVLIRQSMGMSNLHLHLDS